MNNRVKKKMSIFQFMKMYPDDELSQKQFEVWRWGDQARCTHCNSYRISVSQVNQTMPYRCRDCRKRFSVRINTVMAKSHLDYQTWLMAIYMAATGIKGTSSTKLASELDITQKSAWHLGQRIRKAWESDHKLTGEVEIDETYIGGSESNKHAIKKTGTKTAEKSAVVGIVQRDGEIRAQVMDANKTDITEFIKDNVAQGTTIYTDESQLYTGLEKFGYTHKSVNHSRGEYVKDGSTHTNSIESFWANLKRGYHGIHHHMSKKHLHRYVAEFSTRQSIRQIDALAQMEYIALGMINKKLTYKELIA